MDIDERIVSRYENSDEDTRLWGSPNGTLVRLRTWDILERVLPPACTLLDVGGGPGAHAAELARRGHRVTLIDPIERHLQRARERSDAQPDAPFRVRAGVAGELEVDDASVDAVLLLGPLYHLLERPDRVAALAEARRVLRPGGVLAGEVISRNGWLLDASLKRRLGEPGMWARIEHSLATGQSQPDGNALEPSDFWAYFHAPGELAGEMVEAGLETPDLYGVEGFAWLLPELEARMAAPDDLLRALRLCESDETMLGVSGHVIGVARRP
jgi:SAM-dependent methyltransferase